MDDSKHLDRNKKIEYGIFFAPLPPLSTWGTQQMRDIVLKT